MHYDAGAAAVTELQNAQISGGTAAGRQQAAATINADTQTARATDKYITAGGDIPSATETHPGRESFAGVTAVGGLSGKPASSFTLIPAPPASSTSSGPGVGVWLALGVGALLIAYALRLKPAVAIVRPILDAV